MAEFVTPNFDKVVKEFLDKLHSGSTKEQATDYFGLTIGQANAIVIGDICKIDPDEIARLAENIPSEMDPIDITELFLRNASNEALKKLWDSPMPDYTEDEDGPDW